MVKINRKACIKFLVYFFGIVISIPILLSQDPQKKTVRKRIELLNADVDILRKDASNMEVHHMTGNVQFKHNDVFMYCDSAHYIPSKQRLTAFSNVHIEQGDTLDLYGNYLLYEGTSEIAIVKDSVELIDKETHLYTDEINYDVKNKIARYNTGGRITNAESTLTSIIGVYYVSQNLFNFKDSVKIVTPEYLIKADTMDYNTRTEISYFTGPTRLTGDSLYMYCEKGWFDTKKNVTSVWENALIDNRQQIVHGDSLFYNDSTGYGEAWRNVVIQDTTNNLVIEGDYAWYYKQPERFLVTERAVFIQVSDEDSLFLHADTISAVTIAYTSIADTSIPDTTIADTLIADTLIADTSIADTSIAETSYSYRLMRAYHNCKIFSKRLQSKCDSLAYSFKDSVIRFYHEPILWSEEYQLLSDSMAIFTKNRQAHRLELYNSAFVISEVDTTRYNQIKGRSLTGHFADNELRKIEVNGNAESIYFLIDGNEITGVNHSRSARIEAFVEDGRVNEIIDHGNPEGVIDPPDLTTDPAELRLEGFTWFDNLRPKKKSDIFKN